MARERSVGQKGQALCCAGGPPRRKLLPTTKGHPDPRLQRQEVSCQQEEASHPEGHGSLGQGQEVS